MDFKLTAQTPRASSRRQEQQPPPIKSPSKTRATTRAHKTASNNNTKKRKETATTTNQETSPRSLHRFFQPATEEQRWAAHKLAPAATATAIPRRDEHPEEIEDDLIEDDEYGSLDDEIFEHLTTGKDTLPNRPKQQQQQPQTSSESRKRAQPAKPRPSKRFILDDVPVSTTGTKTKTETADRRPWPERYAPGNIEELAVHKKKVADVRSWLTAAFSGKTRHVRFTFLIMNLNLRHMRQF